MLCKAIGIDGGRSHDDLEVGATRQYFAQVAQQKINVQTALVRLIDDQGVVRLEQWIGLRFSQQNAIGHQLDAGVFAQPILKPNFVAHHVAQRRFEFYGNAFGHRTSRNASGLRVANDLAPNRTPIAANLGLTAP